MKTRTWLKSPSAAAAKMHNPLVIDDDCGVEEDKKEVLLRIVQLTKDFRNQ